MTILQHCGAGLLAGAILLVAAAPVRAEEADKYLPADTNLVVRINLKQILGSELLRQSIPAVAHKYGDQFVDLLKAFSALDPNLEKALKDGTLQAFIDAMKDREKVNQGLDMLKEILTEVIVAGNTKSEEPKFLIFLRSPQVSMPMVTLMLNFAERSQPGMIKKEKVGKQTIFEVSMPNQEMTLFLAVPANGWVILATEKDQLKAALETGEKGKSEITKEIKELLGQYKATYSIFLTGQKEEEGKKQVLLASLTMDDGLSGDFSLDVGSPEAAKEKAKELNDLIEEWTQVLTVPFGEVEDAKPLVKEVEAIKAKAEGNKVTVQTRLPAKLFAPLLKIEKKEKKKEKKDDDK
jgi:hypothetical protein